MAATESPRELIPRGLNLALAVVAAAALVGMVNYLGARYYERFDWTASGIYTLSEKSRNLVASLDRDVEMVLFLAQDHELYPPVRELLARYEAASPRIRVREVDSVRNLAEAEMLVEKHGIERQNVVVVATQEDRRVVDVSSLTEVDFSGDAAEVSAFEGEEAFSGALLELTEARKPTIVFTTGHGERALDDPTPEGLSDLQALLGRDNYQLEAWPSATEPAVPEGADLVVVAGPQTRFLDPELAALGTYLDGGGRVLLLTDPRLGEAAVEPGFTGWLAGYGVTMGADVVIDPQGRMPYISDETFQTSSFASHPVTEGIRQARLPVIVSLARSVRRGEVPEGMRVTEVVRTTPEGWAETDLEALPDVAFGEGDVDGPVGLAVVVEPAAKDGPGAQGLEGEAFEESAEPDGGTDGGEEERTAEATAPEAPGMRLVVFGDSDLFSNRLLSTAANGALVHNVMSWLAAREKLLGIPARRPEHVQLALTASQVRRLWLFFVLGLPALAGAVGFTVHRQRRR